MRIVIDNISPGFSTTPEGKGGMRMYLENLISNMLELAPHHDFKLLTPEWNRNFNLPPNPHLRIIPLSNVPRGRFSRVFYEQVFYAREIHRLGCDVFLGLCNTLPFSLKIPSVVVIQSTQFHFIPESYNYFQRNYLRVNVKRSIRRASAVITVSNHSKEDIVRWTNVSSDKVYAVHHGAGVASSLASGSNRRIGAQKTYATKERYGSYILCVSSFYPYKNLFRLIDAFYLLKTKHNLPHNLVIIGGDTFQVTSEQLASHAHFCGVGDSVKFPGRISHSSIDSFYAGADVFVMPSLYETFGLPLLEAMAMRCPVVTSRISSMPEVVGDAAELVDPYDPDSIAQGLANVLTRPAWREELINRGTSRVKIFSWQTAARKTLDVLERVANRTEPSSNELLSKVN